MEYAGILIFVSYIVFCFFVMIGASTRGHSGAGFLVISILFTPVLAAILVLLLRDDTDALNKRAIKEGKMKQCPSCAEVVKKEAVVCPHCHTPFVEAIPAT